MPRAFGRESRDYRFGWYYPSQQLAGMLCGDYDLKRAGKILSKMTPKEINDFYWHQEMVVVKKIAKKLKMRFKAAQ